MAIINGVIYPEEVVWDDVKWYLKDGECYCSADDVDGEDGEPLNLFELLPNKNWDERFNIEAEKALFDVTLKHIIAGDI